MSTYTTREALYGAYLATDPNDWGKYVNQYANDADQLDGKLYYMSLDSSLEGEYAIGESFEDRIVEQYDYETKECQTICLPSRLFTAPDIQSCWNQLFKKLEYCYRNETDFSIPIDLYLYEVDVTDCRIIDSNMLFRNHLVHDAHVNKTHAVIGKPVLKLVKHLMVENTLNHPDENCTYYHPFNDEKYPQNMLCTPLEILQTVNL